MFQIIFLDVKTLCGFLKNLPDLMLNLVPHGFLPPQRLFYAVDFQP